MTGSFIGHRGKAVVGCPVVHANTGLGAAVKVFRCEEHVDQQTLSKADCPLKCGWASSNHLKV